MGWGAGGGQKEQYEHLQGELEMYCDKLMQAYRSPPSGRLSAYALATRPCSTARDPSTGRGLLGIGICAR